jgi:hypothetical protein
VGRRWPTVIVIPGLTRREGWVGAKLAAN